MTETRLIIVKGKSLFRKKRLLIKNNCIVFRKKPHLSRQPLEMPINKGKLPFDLSRHLSHISPVIPHIASPIVSPAGSLNYFIRI